MPAKNSQKQYQENSFHHIYNRGVEKRPIFFDDQDRNVFLLYLKTYLLPKDEDRLQEIVANPEVKWHEKDAALKLLHLNNFFGTIELISYCLMPNHFHFLLWQRTADAIDQFMQSLCTRYSLYLNKKHKRVGHVFQGVYKGVMMETDEQLIHTHRYIHRNPLPLLDSTSLQAYPWSSYPEFLKLRTAPWLNTSKILDLLPKNLQTYMDFIENQEEDERGQIILHDRTIDDEW